MPKAGQFFLKGTPKPKSKHIVVKQYNLSDPDNLADYELLLNDPNIHIDESVRNFSAMTNSMNMTIWYTTFNNK
jgi:hypothetical protein